MAVRRVAFDYPETQRFIGTFTKFCTLPKEIWKELSYVQIVGCFDGPMRWPPKLIEFRLSSDGRGIHVFETLIDLPKSLKYLELWKCFVRSSFTLPEGLEVFVYENSPAESQFPILPSTLKRLECFQCHRKSIPPLPPGLICLRYGGNFVAELPPLPTNLEILNVSRNPLESLPPLPDSLRTLHIGFTKLQTLPRLPPKLETLSLPSHLDPRKIRYIPKSLGVCIRSHMLFYRCDVLRSNIQARNVKEWIEGRDRIKMIRIKNAIKLALTKRHF